MCNAKKRRPINANKIKMKMKRVFVWSSPNVIHQIKPTNKKTLCHSQVVVFKEEKYLRGETVPNIQ